MIEARVEMKIVQDLREEAEEDEGARWLTQKARAKKSHISLFAYNFPA